MKSLFWRAGLVLAMVTAFEPGGIAQETPPGDEGRPSFPGEVELVTVDVVVTDEKGNPVTGLSVEDFTVEDEGVPQAISSFEAVELPAAPSDAPPPRPSVSTNMLPERRTSRSFLILFDDLHLTPENAPQAKGAVASFLREGVREGDRVGLLATSGDAWWNTRMEAGREDLLAILRRLEGRRIPENRLDRLSDWEAMRIAQFNDTIVGQQVLRRFQTLRLMPDNAFPSSRVDRTRLEREENDTLYFRGVNDLMIESRASETYHYVRFRCSRTLGALERAMESLIAAKGRKSLILVSNGFVMDNSVDEFKEVIQTARRANVAVYFLNTRGLEGLEGLYGADMVAPIASRDMGAVLADTTQESAGAEHLAETTGGFTVRNTNDLAGGIQRIARESLSYYLLGYNPSDTPRDGSYRRIEVKVKGEDLNVRARKGYYAPRDGEEPEQPAENIDVEIQRALDSPFFNDQIPLRMTAIVREEALYGRARTLITTEVDVTDLTFRTRDADGYRVGVLHFLLGVAEREASEVQREDKEVEIVLRPEALEQPGPMWYAVTREFSLGPGGYQAKAVVRDAEDRRVGTVAHEFTVPELTGLRVSTPILSDQLQRTSEDGAGAMALARRQFPSGGSLFCQFDVYGAAKGQVTGMPRVSAGYALVRSDGTTVMYDEPTAILPTSLGYVSRLWGLPLEGIAPGEYELVITVRDEIADEVRTLREPLSITAARESASSGD